MCSLLLLPCSWPKISIKQFNIGGKQFYWDLYVWPGTLRFWGNFLFGKVLMNYCDPLISFWYGWNVSFQSVKHFILTCCFNSFPLDFYFIIHNNNLQWLYITSMLYFNIMCVQLNVMKSTWTGLRFQSSTSSSKLASIIYSKCLIVIILWIEVISFEMSAFLVGRKSFFDQFYLHHSQLSDSSHTKSHRKSRKALSKGCLTSHYKICHNVDNVLKYLIVFHGKQYPYWLAIGVLSKYGHDSKTTLDNPGRFLRDLTLGL